MSMEKRIRKPRHSLTARQVDALKTAGKYYDGHGLFLRINASGSKQWLQRLTIQGKQRELGLGSPPVVTIAMAREMALENRRTSVMEGDPLAEKRAAKIKSRPPTFRECVERYAQVRLDEFSNEKHRREWTRSIERLAFPVLADMPVQDISTRDVLRMFEPHWRERTITAKKLRGRVEAVLCWATVAGHREGDNPARWSGNLKELLPAPTKIAKVIHHGALALSDAPCWWSELARRDGMAARALQFAALTAARSGEVRGATWTEIDETAGLWTISAGRMKANREHRVPLPADAVDLLRALPREAGNDLVFFAPRGGPLSDMALGAAMKRIQAAEVETGRKGFVDPRTDRPAVPHGLRSTFRQWTAEQGFPRDMAEIALAHVVGSEVERAYQRSDMLERRRDMMADWAAFLRGESAGQTGVTRLRAVK